MAIKFQYNKTSMQNLNKQLKIRVRALPTIKNKESALRMEVKKAKDKVHSLDGELRADILKYDGMRSLWNEFEPGLVSVDDVKLEVKKIAGVKTPVLIDIIFSVKEFSLFESPVWFYDGVNILKHIVTIAIEKEIFTVKMELLEKARRKTTQKVNLYEKVQIPGFQEALLKIKRFMEDEENLSKSSQKIVKTRQMMEEAS
ncbi:MAG: V-type ATP synthase subunit D [Candidatus Delongbacteria bacterium]|nr:V-type ATP synthase subunit D [Candidatus Delongbacteria bacterium]MDD4205311.1 V-type ATP synthase subunit D [Candidatus Delongbacteria bacterium]MDY0017045.1 V-type ATP synthase subunit D [Candidatus Delongbacteria bacterium]